MKYIYDQNKDKALEIPIKLIWANYSRKKIMINSIDDGKYGDEAIKALGDIDERFKNVSKEFKNPVIRMACAMELGCKNLENESYTELIYPKYTDVLRGIYYYQNLERTSLTNPNDLSIYEEARDYKLNYCPKITRPLTEEEKARSDAFKEVSDRNYLKRIQAEEDKEIYDLVEQIRHVLINSGKDKKAS